VESSSLSKDSIQTPSTPRETGKRKGNMLWSTRSVRGGRVIVVEVSKGCGSKQRPADVVKPAGHSLVIGSGGLRGGGCDEILFSRGKKVRKGQLPV